jgi:hypothetical protein
MAVLFCRHALIAGLIFSGADKPAEWRSLQAPA